MRRTELTVIVGIWAMTVGSCFAQMATFPPPPPLAPAPKPVEQPVMNNPGSQNSPDLNSPSGQGGNGNLGGAGSSPVSRPDINAPISAATLSSMTALDDKVTLQAGDRISFRVLEDQDSAVPRTVTDTGEVDFPYVGRVKVGGKTCHQVAIELKQLLEVDYYKRATVIVGLDSIVGQGTAAGMAAQDFVWLMGQVRTVGPLPISKLQPQTLSQIILRAGGFGDFGDQRRVKIIHRGATTGKAPEPSESTEAGQAFEIIDVKAVYDGKSTIDPIVQPNDYIIVPKKVINF